MLYSPAASTGPVARAGAAIGVSDVATIGLAKCDPNGNFSFTNLPDDQVIKACRTLLESKK
jgi:hypothetical protein